MHDISVMKVSGSYQQQKKIFTVKSPQISNMKCLPEKFFFFLFQFRCSILKFLEKQTYALTIRTTGVAVGSGSGGAKNTCLSTPSLVITPMRTTPPELPS